MSYGELARRIDQPSAARAVGSANGRNPISVIVPCHRVISADGTLTGYGAGTQRKRHLLDLEATTIAPRLESVDQPGPTWAVSALRVPGRWSCGAQAADAEGGRLAGRDSVRRVRTSSAVRSSSMSTSAVARRRSAHAVCSSVSDSIARRPLGSGRRSRAVRWAGLSTYLSGLKSRRVDVDCHFARPPRSHRLSAAIRS